MSMMDLYCDVAAEFSAVTKKMIERAKDMATDPYRDYEYIGIRVQDGVPFDLGEMSHISHIWDDGDDTGEELPGVCVIDGRKAEYSVLYSGDHVAIIGGNHAEYGEDPGEIIISDPVVLAVLA